MPVPSSILDLSLTAGLNNPQGGEDVFPQLDNYLRAHAAFIAELRDSVTSIFAEGRTVAETFTATEGQTVITLAGTYSVGTNAIAVYVGNGGALFLVPGVDYTETSESTVTLLSPLVAGDRITVVYGSQLSFSIDDSGYAKKAGGNVYTGAQTVTFSALTDAANIATDASLSNHFSVTLGGNRTLDNPTNLADGVILNFWIKQDGTGSRTLAYGSKFKWPGGTAPTLSTTAAALDLIVVQYHATQDILACSITKDFR